MPSKGLMIAGGIGEALSNGMKTYLAARGIRNDEDRFAQQNLNEQEDRKIKRLGLLGSQLEKGFAYDEESGAFKETPEARMNRLADLEYKRAQTEYLNRNKGQGLMKKNREFESLPGDERKVVETLATKNANKIAISNQIDSVLGGWDKLSDDQKLMQGRQLIKVLNSTEGADAVGTEESKRLGAKLEFAMGNLFNSNHIQFGRDLPGFKEQAGLTSNAIKNAVKANEQEISKRYQSVGIDRGDSVDPDIQAYAKQHNLDYSVAEKIINGRKNRGQN